MDTKISRLTHSMKFRNVVVGLGIFITLLLLPWMREGFASVLSENNFFGVFFTQRPGTILKKMNE